MFVDGCRPGLAPGISGIHFADMSGNIATAQERTCHEGRREGGGRRRRAPMEKGRVAGGRSDRDAHSKDESKGRHNRGQIARTDNLAGMHASVLMTSREHSDETDVHTYAHTHHQGTQERGQGSGRGHGMQKGSNGISEVLFDTPRLSGVLRTTVRRG